MAKEKTKVCFVSNFFNHHQKPISEALAHRDGVAYSFIATSQMPDERKRMGYEMDSVPAYVRYTYTDKPDRDECEKHIEEADAVIFGSAPEYLLKERKKQKKLFFRYSERMFKRPGDMLRYFPGVISLNLQKLRRIPMYLLCASAYTAADYAQIGVFRGRAYKWGYFPETKRYDPETLFSGKRQNRILWCGRFLDWKHPDDALAVAKRLKEDGYEFELNLIGTGEMENILRQQIEENDLYSCVHLLGSMKPEQVREYMEQAGIYLFTSDFNEGWGAVLNESMNSGCAVVASHAVGSVPYLMEHRENGLIYESGNTDDLYNKVKYLLDHPDEQKRMGENAYRTIAQLWNAEVAAERFLKLVEQIKDHGYCDLYESGPCSRAEVLKNNWFKEE